MSAPRLVIGGQWSVRRWSVVGGERSDTRSLDPTFLKPMGISQHRLVKEIGVPAQRIGQIIEGCRAITADTDLRLCRFYGLSDGYWLRVQAAHDTASAREQLQATLDRIRPWQDHHTN